MRRGNCPGFALLALVAACGGDPEPMTGPPPPPAACRLLATPARQQIARGGMGAVTLEAPDGVCEIERVVLDRGVFQIVDEPTAPFTLAAGETRVLQIRHDPTVMLPRGVPVRQLAFVTRTERLELLLEGEAPRGPCGAIVERDVVISGVSLGDTATAAATIDNACDVPITVTEARIAVGSSVFSVELPAGGLAVPADGTAALTVRFRPTEPAVAVGELRVKTDDAATGELSVRLIGAPAVGELAFLPRWVLVPSAPWRSGGPGGASECLSPGQEAILANVGTRAITGVSVAVQGASGGVFVVDQIAVQGRGIVDRETPFDLEPGGWARVRVRFRPGGPPTPGTRAEARLEASGGGLMATAALTADTLDENVQRARFDRPARPALDLAFVPNPAGGRLLDLRIVPFGRALIQAAAAAGFDYRITVVGPESFGDDAGLPIACSEHPSVLVSGAGTIPEQGDAIECAVERRLGRARRASPMLAGARWMERELADGNLRPGAHWLVVTVSPSEDGSALAPEALSAYFQDPGGRTALVGATLSAVVDLGAGCAEPTPRLSQAVDETGGLRRDHCANSWAGHAEAILAGLSGEPESRYRLPTAAEAADLAVTVEGALLPASSARLDDTGRILSIEPRWAPRAGERVSVEFRARCDAQ